MLSRSENNQFKKGTAIEVLRDSFEIPWRMLGKHSLLSKNCWRKVEELLEEDRSKVEVFLKENVPW